MEQIQYSTNPFGGIIINPQSLDSDPMNFSKHLGNSLQGWSAQGFKVAWLELPTEKAALVSEAIKLGFNYKNFAKEIIKNSKVQLFLVEDRFQLAKFIKANIHGKKIVIGMGAGTISSWMRELPKLLS